MVRESEAEPERQPERVTKVRKHGAAEACVLVSKGGQMPISRRIPKRGFNNARFATTFQVVNLESIAARFEAGQVIGLAELYKARLVHASDSHVKVLARGDIDKPLTIRAHAFSAQAKSKIEAAGGKAEVI